MTKTQLLSLKYFSREVEITSTGGTLEGLSYELFQRLDKLRERICSPINILKGGLNSGKHINNNDVHSQGLACDFVTKHSSITGVFRAALDSGFLGIGIYWNGRTYSFHVDIRKYQAFWFGVKDAPGKEWEYLPFEIADPKKIIIRIPRESCGCYHGQDSKCIVFENGSCGKSPCMLSKITE